MSVSNPFAFSTGPVFAMYDPANNSYIGIFGTHQAASAYAGCCSCEPGESLILDETKRTSYSGVTTGNCWFPDGSGGGAAYSVSIRWWATVPKIIEVDHPIEVVGGISVVSNSNPNPNQVGSIVAGFYSGNSGYAPRRWNGGVTYTQVKNLKIKATNLSQDGGTNYIPTISFENVMKQTSLSPLPIIHFGLRIAPSNIFDPSLPAPVVTWDYELCV